MAAMRFLAILTAALVLGLGMAHAAERPVVTIHTIGYALLEECTAGGPRNLCFTEEAALPLRINIGDEITLDLGRIGVVVEYYVNALWYDADRRGCRATNNTLREDNTVWVLIIDHCKVGD